MIVYVDVLLLLNTLVNYFILLGVKKITRSYTSRFRILSGAIIGGAASLLLFVESLGILMTFLKIASGIVMIAITFGVKPYKLLIKNMFWLFAISILLGGNILIIYFFTETDLMLYSNGIVYFDIDMSGLIICSVIAYVIITLITRFTDKKAPKNKEYYIKIQGEDGVVCGKALMDTGNNLREPFSDFPVILVNKNIFNTLYKEKDKIRLIPAQTVNGEGILKAFRPIFVEIENYKTDKIYIAESNTKLDEYEILLNINLEGEMNNA